MTMPEKKAPIYITDTKTGDVVFVRTVCNLPRIFKDFKEGVEKVKDETTDRIRTDAVRFMIKGIVDGVQLSTHKINLYTDTSRAPSGEKRENKPPGVDEQKKSGDSGAELIKL